MKRANQAKADFKSGTSLISVAKVGEIEQGKRKIVIINGREVAVINLGGELCAVRNACPHEGFPLTYAPVYQGRILCPNHGWMFEVKTGVCLRDASYPLKTYRIVIEGADVKIET
ncbi:MAG: Rieske (2Fe-2S) protein [Deltaproteobacteria bacterium]